MAALRNFRTAGKKIVAVARNYRAHAAELNNPVPDKPLLFFKPTSSYVSEGQPIKVAGVQFPSVVRAVNDDFQAPPGCQSLHHEVELGVVIAKNASSIRAESAMNYVGGYALALDMTARDFQNEAKEKGQPWFLAKGFDSACPVSEFIPPEKIDDPHNIDLWLKVNGKTVQNGNTKNMIFTIPALLEYITKFVTLEPGDLLLTGTPEGIGKVESGDKLECGLGKDIATMTFVVE